MRELAVRLAKCLMLAYMTTGGLLFCTALAFPKYITTDNFLQWAVAIIHAMSAILAGILFSKEAQNTTERCALHAVGWAAYFLILGIATALQVKSA